MINNKNNKQKGADMKILIVEDDKAISRLLQINLENAGFICDVALDGAQALEKIDENPDLILLDVMLPEVDGFQLLGYIKPFKIPVIMLTARNMTSDKIRGLNLGADDYITKPFDMSELIARVEAVLRRAGKISDKFIIDDIEIDYASRIIKKAGEVIVLSPKEYDLVVFLIQNKNLALFRDVIINNVWGYDFDGDSRTLDLHISRIRQKLSWKEKIITLKRVGFRLQL